jgi:soluble lytic murein transglycosylase-like protein
MATAPPLKGDHIARSAQRHGVPVNLMRAISRTESDGRRGAVSKKGARGEFQVMPETAKELGYTPDEMHDKEYGAEAAARHLKKLRERKGSWTDAVAAYNAGAARVAYRKRTGEPLPAETREYVRRVKRRSGEHRLSGRDIEEAMGSSRARSAVGYEEDED